MALNKEALDQFASRGCTMPSCDHKNHENQIYLHAKCHLDAQVVVYYVALNMLQVACAGCGGFVCRIGVQHTPIEPCHPEYPLEVEYTAGRGTLHVICNFCKKQIAEIPVQV